MRALIVLAAVSAAALLPGGANAQELCLYGGPDAAADLACGPAYIAPGYNSDAGAAESRILTPGAARPNGPAESRLTAGAPAFGPALPAPPSAFAPAQPDAGIYAAPPSAPLAAMVEPYSPGPTALMPQSGIAAPQFQPAPAPAFAPESAPSSAYAYAPDSAPPPPPAPPPVFASGQQVFVEGPPPGAFAYAYESADGGAFAWRYETPSGPAWAYAYETPQGWAYAYAYDAAPAGPPPPVIEAAILEPGPYQGDAYQGDAYQGRAYRGPYAGPVGPEPIHHGAARYGADWRYSEERLFGPGFRRQLHLVQTYTRESEFVSAVGGPIIGPNPCGGCAPYAPNFYAPVYPTHGVFTGPVFAGPGGFSSAPPPQFVGRASASSSAFARQTSQGQASAGAYARAGNAGF
jgi:hypothetical protein